MNCHETNEILMCACDIVENLFTLSKFDPPRCWHEHKEGMLESVFCETKVEMSGTDDRTRKTMTGMTDNVKTRSQLFTCHLERFSGAAKAFDFILMISCQMTCKSPPRTSQNSLQHPAPVDKWS